MSKRDFVPLLKEKGIVLSDLQIEQFETYYKLLVSWNEKMNLTAITDEDDVYLKHFYDCISTSFYYDFSKKQHLLDVGAGAGFPSIPLKIVYPHLRISIVDSLQKRIHFLEELVLQLQLSDVSLYHDRAELFGQKRKYREKFDVVTARAVANMTLLSELCLPFVKINGHFIAMKGAGAEEELHEATKHIARLGGRVMANESFTLPLEQSVRHMIVIKKYKKTPRRFPRKPEVLAKVVK